MANDTIQQLLDLGLTIYVTCKGYDASLDAPYINGIPLPDDYDGDTHPHLVTSHCKPTKIVSLRYEGDAVDVIERTVVITISGMNDWGSHELVGSDTKGWKTVCGSEVTFAKYGTNLVSSVDSGVPTCRTCLKEA